MAADSDLPEGWAFTRLGEILTVSYGKGLTETNRISGEVPVYGSNGVVGKHNAALTHGSTIILGRKGTVGAVHFSTRPCWPIDTTYFIDEFCGLDPTYIALALRSLTLAELDTSTAIPGLNRDDLYAQPISLPPLAEQKRIVTKVEALLARVNAARERLARVPAILKRFRQVVLAAACSGRLTEEWRALHPQTRPAIEAVRGQFDRLRLAGAKISNPPVIQVNVTLDLPTLPETWEWVPLGLLGEDPLNPVQTGPFGALLHRDEFVAEGIPVIAVGNLTGMGFTTEGLYYITPQKAQQLARFDVNAGDLLFARSGATLGKVCVAPDHVRD